MSVVKDFYCIECEHETPSIVVESCDVVSMFIACPQCKHNTGHHVLCNGGTGKRYRVNDWDMEEVMKGVRWMGPHATQDGETVKDNVTGEVYENSKKFSEGVREERRGEIEMKRRVRKHGPRVFMDYGSR